MNYIVYFALAIINLILFYLYGNDFSMFAAGFISALIVLNIVDDFRRKRG